MSQLRFAPDCDFDGYLIFDCTCEGGQEPSIMFDRVDHDDAVYALMTSCFYVGHVRGDH